MNSEMRQWYSTGHLDQLPDPGRISPEGGCRLFPQYHDFRIFHSGFRRHYPPVPQNNDSFCPLADKLHIVGSNHHGFCDCFHILQGAHDLFSCGDIQICGWLIQKQNTGIQRNTNGKACPAHLAAGKKAPSRFFSSFSRKRSSSSSVRFALSGTRRTSMA